jgi:hypothetical protein
MAPSASMSNTCKQKSGSTQLGVPKRGDFTYNLATALWLSLLPANHPRPAALPKRIVGRTAALRLCLCPCLTPASKNHIQFSSGCRQTSDFTSVLATALCVSLLPATHPNPVAPTKRVVVGLTAALRLRPRLCLRFHLQKRIRFNPAWVPTHSPPDLKTRRSHTLLATQCGILLPVFRALVFGLALCFGIVLT